MFWIGFGYGAYLRIWIRIQGAIPVPCRRMNAYIDNSQYLLRTSTLRASESHKMSTKQGWSGPYIFASIFYLILDKYLRISDILYIRDT